MLKVNVGLSRKVSQDYQSKGYSLNIEGELPSEVLNNPVALADATNNLFALANQLLDEQVGIATNATESTPRSRRGSAPTYGRSPNGHTRTAERSTGYRQNGGTNGHTAPSTTGNGNGNGNGNGGERLLTQAQSRAIGNMARKLGQDPDQWVQDQYGVVRLGELTIKQASEAIDALKRSIEKVGV